MGCRRRRWQEEGRRTSKFGAAVQCDRKFHVPRNVLQNVSWHSEQPALSDLLGDGEEDLHAGSGDEAALYLLHDRQGHHYAELAVQPHGPVQAELVSEEVVTDGRHGGSVEEPLLAVQVGHEKEWILRFPHGVGGVLHLRGNEQVLGVLRVGMALMSNGGSSLPEYEEQ